LFEFNSISLNLGKDISLAKSSVDIPLSFGPRVILVTATLPVCGPDLNETLDPVLFSSTIQSDDTLL